MKRKLRTPLPGLTAEQLVSRLLDYLAEAVKHEASELTIAIRRGYQDQFDGFHQHDLVAEITFGHRDVFCVNNSEHPGLPELSSPHDILHVGARLFGRLARHDDFDVAQRLLALALGLPGDTTCQS